jgi:hypothetical protein
MDGRRLKSSKIPLNKNGSEVVENLRTRLVEDLINFAAYFP